MDSFTPQSVGTSPPGSQAERFGSQPETPVDQEGESGEPEMISLAEVERRHVLRILAATGGSREESARILGISRRTLTRMLQRWGMIQRRH
jgi:DNA-binding NtrC family response regulator